MAISTYAELTTEISSWAVVSYTSAQTDNFIALAEAAITRRLGPNYRRTTTGTITTDSTGLATLPTGFVRMRSIVRNVTGSMPLKQVNWDSTIMLNPYGIEDDPAWYAISGSSLKVAPIVADDFIARWDAALSGLSSTTTTNWLLTLAPDIYLTACRAQAAEFEEKYDSHDRLTARWRDLLDDLVGQSVVAEYGNVEMVPDTVMP